ncbi:MAG: hypothetical protein AAF721_08355 [Myxococcota bacterium]
MPRTPIVCALAPALLVALGGCFGEFVPPAAADATSTVADSSDADSGSSTTGSATTTGIAGSSESTDGGPAPLRLPSSPSCHLDILFVIDFSASMGAYEAVLFEAVFGLVGRFPTLLGELGSYHVGITTNSSVPWNDSAFFPAGEEPLDCTGVGSLSRPPDEACYDLLEGNPYIGKNTDLGAALSCTAMAVDPGGRALEPADPVAAIRSAISSDMNEDGHCNAGFHDPADPLVVVLVTDADDDTSPLEPVAAAADILDSVGLNPAKLAMSVISGSTCSCGDDGKPGCGAECPPNPKHGPPQAPCRILGLTELLFAADGLEDHVRFTDICETPTDRFDPFGAALIEAVADQADRVCAAAAAP